MHKMTTTTNGRKGRMRPSGENPLFLNPLLNSLLSLGNKGFMMKQRIMLLLGLTAVYLLILISCTQPTTSEPTTPPTIAPTALPTAAPDPTPTPTPTAEEQANQRILNDGRFTTLLDNLTQEIGRDLSDAEQAQVLALARALWLPGQLDESDWLPDPAGATLHWRPALVGREGPVLLVEETQPDSPYAAGALIFWQGERLLSLTPGGVDYYFEFGRIQQNDWNFDTWIEYDAEGNIASFVHPDTVQYVTPESEDWRIFTLSDLDDQGNRVNSGLYWENGGTPIEITTGPGNVPITDYLAANPNLQLTQTEQDSQLMVALIDAESGSLHYTLNPDNMQWQEARAIGEVRQGEEIQQVWDGQEWVDIHRNLAVLNGELKIYDESSNQWDTYPIPPELQQVIASEGWELTKVSTHSTIVRGRSQEFVVVLDQKDNPVIGLGAANDTLYRTYYESYYDTGGPLVIYPAYHVESLDPATLEQLKSTLQPVRFSAGSRTGGSGTVYPNIRSSRDLLVTDVIQHATNHGMMTEFQVEFKTNTGQFRQGTLVAKHSTTIEIEHTGGGPIQSPPGLSVIEGDTIGFEMYYTLTGFTGWDRNFFLDRLNQDTRNKIASFLWNNASISTADAIALFEQGGWEEISGHQDEHFLLMRIIVERN
jgi:hypothetical protein